ncbi:complement receptor type 2-like isoform X2 [Pocillopora damicornis]|uniref:complement receptor type 2-like isoform X2 n=1 Tax=Pocillopora damicornis TaxID=46731 RepID=UPI000F55325D|nr:complement receptor type 2-like isoform X2 [Pocillopora damicornis]
MNTTISNGTILRNETQDGGVLYQFQCNPYFYLNGSSVISCLRGQWNGSRPSCLPGCLPLKNIISDGTVLRNETQDGEIIYRFQCNSGFILNGSSVISCFRGQRNGSTPSCLPDW